MQEQRRPTEQGCRGALAERQRGGGQGWEGPGGLSEDLGFCSERDGMEGRM